MPQLGVEVVISDDQGKIVLTKRNDLPVWCLPGGHVEAGESLAAAAIREVKEETGLEVKITRLVGIYSRPNWFEGSHEIVFAAEPTGGQLQKDGIETVDIGFFDHANFPQPILAWSMAHIADALEEKQAVVRLQDISFPLPGVTRHDFFEMPEEDRLPFVKEIVADLCTPLSEDKNQKEIG
jgi:ADP-ribose pyrophosphatase YjhB (NUDIX family)